MACGSERQRGGVVVRFNSSTWWGTIELDNKRTIEFHGTCYRGMTQDRGPRAGDRVLVIFSDATRERLLSVEAA